MSLKEFIEEEQIKNTMLNVIRVLFSNGPHKIDITTDEWSIIVEKMFEEWKDVDNISIKLQDEDQYKPLRLMAKKFNMSPRELLVRTKLMYFVAKSEIMRMELEELRKK